MRSGVSVFAVVMLGQFVSLLGSELSGFALGVWVYQETGSETQFAFTVLFLVLPRVILSPLAGALVDRWDRRWVMILSDSGAALTTLLAALLLFNQSLEVWHIYVVNALASAFGTFQRPAFTAATTPLIPQQHYGRASGVRKVIYSIATLAGPLLAGFLVVSIGIANVLLIDFATFLFAVSTLLLVRFPRPERSAESVEAEGSLLREALQGWRYVTRRPGLLGLMLLYAATSFLGVTTEVLLTPYVLSFSTADALGVVASATGAGFLAGGALLALWGGPRRRIYGILGFEFLVCVCTILIGVQAPPLWIAFATFLYFVFIALSDGSSEALWQSKVAPDFQGRVFAIREMIALSALPLGLVITAPLAEFVFEPMLSVDGAWADGIGRIVGAGPGRGIGLIFILTGVFNIVAIVVAALNARIRLVEHELPNVLSGAAHE